MKKLLSLIIVLCMVLSVCFTLASCQDPAVDPSGNGGKDIISVKDFEDNLWGALLTVSKNTTTDFFGDYKAVGDIVANVGNGGSVSVIFESDSLMGDITSIKETIYMNGKGKEFVSDTSVNFAGEELAGRIFIGKDGLIVNGESLLGSDKSLAINPATLAEKFANSTLAQLFELPAENMEMVIEIMETVNTAYQSLFEAEGNTDIENAIDISKYIDILNMSVAEENGSIVISNTLDNATVKALYEAMFNDYINIFKGIISEFDIPEADAAIEDLELQIDAVMASIDETIEINVTNKIYVDKKTAKVTKTTVNGTLVGKQVEEGENDTIIVEGTTTYTDDKLVYDLDMVNGDEAIGMDYTITKAIVNDAVTYSLKMSGYETLDGETDTTDLADMTLVYIKASGAYSLTMTVDVYGEKQTVILEGTAKVEGDTLTLELTSVTMGDITVKCRFALIFDKEATIPTRPTDALDVVDLTEDQIMEIMTEFMESPLGQIIFVMLE